MTKFPQSSVVPVIIYPSLSGLQSFLQGRPTNVLLELCEISFCRQVSCLSGIRAPAFSSSQCEIPGEIPVS